MIRYIPIQSISFKHIKPLVNLHALNNAYILTIVNVQKKSLVLTLSKITRYLKKFPIMVKYICPVQKQIILLIPTKYGRKEASVFTGFCGYHDKVVFQAIEDNDFAGTEEQIFLYVYRAFAIEYHKKQEALEMEKFLFSKRPSLINANGFESPFTGMHLSISDLNIEKDIFDKALIEKRYDVLTSVIWKFPHFSNFAASGLEAPSKDIDGNQIQDLLNKQQNVGHIFYSVFPENNATYAIIADKVE